MRRTLILATIVVLASSTASMATITDDIDPQAANVHVGLINPDTTGYKGYVVVTVRLSDGSTAQSNAGYHIASDGSLTVTAKFKKDVVQVLDVSIIENPDPIVG